jgi:S-adenosylmethionine:tRNA ribosyltransferase-isomerase
MNLRDLQINQYDYHLPEDRIAAFPLAERDASKLLLYKSGEISNKVFTDLPGLLEPDDHLVLNNTKVIPARLYFRKPTGGLIEIFCLEPISGHGDFQLAMSQSGSIEYECLVGGAAKWKQGFIYIQGEGFELKAEMLGRGGEFFHIKFSWTPEEKTFSEVLDLCGELPLPPYFNRSTEAEDIIRYQTVYSEHKGSVAAPTAGLHFTPEVFEKLKAKGVKISYITLHVGAGTFKPVTADRVGDHDMHREYFSIPQNVLKELSEPTRGRIIAVGTTTLRALESAYWLAAKVNVQETESYIGQWEAYDMVDALTRTEAFQLLYNETLKRSVSSLMASTAIMVGPGYDFKVIEGLITNFHLPKSTLLLLVSALIGDDWKSVYEHALRENYRFLSYGDSSLLWRT